MQVCYTRVYKYRERWRIKAVVYFFCLFLLLVADAQDNCIINTRILSVVPGLLEWLLDRDTCKDKESREICYNIITIIHNHNMATKKVLDEKIIQNITLFYNQGPFYIEAEPSVTFERDH